MLLDPRQWAQQTSARHVSFEWLLNIMFCWEERQKNKSTCGEPELLSSVWHSSETGRISRSNLSSTSLWDNTQLMVKYHRALAWVLLLHGLLQIWPYHKLPKNGWGGKGPLKIIWSNSSAQAVTWSQLPRAVSRQALNLSGKERWTQTCLPLLITALAHDLLQNLEFKLRTCLFHKIVFSIVSVQLTG